ncbi:hypothetical protein RA307_31130 [Xanthobacteraceae bacterium Astr-EGSB]|uniref:hypothetical protein n=1 Tax=Astrobacterium formosum TaxID=3069710 RepID=UPI0027AF1B2B|nr:hypothetical protein [Xanthobacteraceae bacterium Astr-EGSB]
MISAGKTRTVVRRLLAAIDAEREARAAMHASPFDAAVDYRWMAADREFAEAYCHADRLIGGRR